MYKTILWSAVGLAVAAGGPALYYSSSNYWKGAKVQGDANPNGPAVAARLSGAQATAGAPDALPPIPPSIRWEGEAPRTLAEVLRFDVTIEWILRRWPRVSAGLAHLDLQGYRVPLVTGTTETDLAGSLTYYFNPQQRVERITFHGKTGDPRHLVALLAAHYKFAHRPVNNPGLFVYESVSPSGQAKGLLKIHSASVIKSGSPRQRFDVELIMERTS